MVVVFFLFSDFAVFNNIEQYKTVEHEKVDDDTRYYLDQAFDALTGGAQDYGDDSWAVWRTCD